MKEIFKPDWKMKEIKDYTLDSLLSGEGLEEVYEATYNLSEEEVQLLTGVVTPTHYPNAGGDDLINFCVNNDVGFIEGNIMKYVLRYKKKNGLEDLEKAKTYLNRLIDSHKE